MRRRRKKPSPPKSRRASELAAIDAHVAEHGVEQWAVYPSYDEIKLDPPRCFYAAKNSRSLKRAVHESAR